MRLDLKNLNLLFNKEYYQELGKPDFHDKVIEKNFELINTCFNHDTDYIRPPLENCEQFVLKVLYPGLLIGTGNPHGVGDIGNSEEDVNIGFSFDYVTGQPYIPGSSVKGVLRSHFKNREEAVAEILKSNGYSEIDTKTVKALEEAIFDYSDIFFDAVVFKGNHQNRLIGFDYITPHSLVTKNPVPIRIIKVLPGVCFEFRFKICDKEIGGVKFSVENIKWLFQQMIILFGAGAKTNVGYGIFIEYENAVIESGVQQETIHNDINVCPLCGGRKSPSYPTCRKCSFLTKF